MKGKVPMTLAEMAARSSTTAGRLVCPKCGCCDFKTYGKGLGHIETQRYKQCRNCRCKILTAQGPERMVRIVKESAVDDESQSDESVV